LAESDVSKQSNQSALSCTARNKSVMCRKNRREPFSVMFFMLHAKRWFGIALTCVWDNTNRSLGYPEVWDNSNESSG